MSRYAQLRDARVSVEDSLEEAGVTLYRITVRVGPASWSVLHRYRDFCELHTGLVANHGVAKDLLPPKKAIRNKCPRFVESRKEGLDSYLKSVFNYLQLTMPREFAIFLDFHHYDILFLLQNLAVKFYTEGDKLLVKSEHYEITPLELYAISERVKEPRTPFELSDRKYDFSHILDFCSQLKNLQIMGSYDNILTSNICSNKLPFDLIPFKSLRELIIVDYPVQLISNAGTLRDTLQKLRVHRTKITQISDIILCDVLHKEVVDNDKHMIWKELSEVNLSCNTISNIDESIKLLPKLQVLILCKNKLTEISNLSSLPLLSHLNLSENLFTVCEDWHSKIGKIISIDLSQNTISSLACFSKLYSLESLDLSCNQIVDIEEVQHICKLPCLENLRLTANPVASVVDYRVKVIEQFNGRMQDICLDNEKASEKEIDTARVLQALRILKEGKEPDLFNTSDNVFCTYTAMGGTGL